MYFGFDSTNKNIYKPVITPWRCNEILLEYIHYEVICNLENLEKRNNSMYAKLLRMPCL